MTGLDLDAFLEGSIPISAQEEVTVHVPGQGEVSVVLNEVSLLVWDHYNQMARDARGAGNEDDVEAMTEALQLMGAFLVAASMYAGRYDELPSDAQVSAVRHNMGSTVRENLRQKVLTLCGRFSTPEDPTDEDAADPLEPPSAQTEGNSPTNSSSPANAPAEASAG